MKIRPHAKKALVLHRGIPGSREICLGRILEFFGIPFESCCLSELENTGTESVRKTVEYAIIAPIDVLDELLKLGNDGFVHLKSAAAVYLYATDDIPSCKKALLSLPGIQGGALKSLLSDSVHLSVSSDFPDLTGPMTGIQVSTKPGQHDFVFTPEDNAQFTPIISADDGSVFFVSRIEETPCFISTSSQMIDLDAPLTQGYYDVKPHFCSAVPLIMFLKYLFADVIWQPTEHGACLIIDDPLLKSRYGHCDFRKQLDLMKRHGFTMDIAFIPWNWRRTSNNEAAFFRREMNHFSVSIHGCDHIAAEFGDMDTGDLTDRARWAQMRMYRHQERTGLRHDPIMVFPQGVFSATCPDVLKRTGYIAAVNTEVMPVGYSEIKTRIRDVWDVAITRYGSFPIFTRRYAHHGLENFAFDLLLGKPCLVVAHHAFFKNGGQAVIELVESLSSLNCKLQWRPLGEVLRRACRQRASGDGSHEYWMYCQELSIKNIGSDAALYNVRKKEEDPALISRVEEAKGEVEWNVCDGHIEFSASIPGGEERLFKVIYKEASGMIWKPRNMKYKMRVAARRLLSELRDECVFYEDRFKQISPRLRSIIGKNHEDG